MGLLEGGGNQEVKVRVGIVSQQWFLGSAHCVLRSAFSLTAGILPYCSSSMRGQQGSPHRPRPRVALRVLAMGVLVELFAGSGLYGDGKSCVLRDSSTGLLTCGRVTFHFPPSVLPQRNHLPESQILLQDYEDHLVFSFPIHP